MVFKVNSWQANARYWMKQKKMTYRSLAAKVQIPYVTLFRYMNKPKSTEDLSVHVYLMICRILEMNPVEFFVEE